MLYIMKIDPLNWCVFGNCHNCDAWSNYCQFMIDVGECDGNNDKLINVLSLGNDHAAAGLVGSKKQDFETLMHLKHKGFMEEIMEDKKVEHDLWEKYVGSCVDGK